MLTSEILYDKTWLLRNLKLKAGARNVQATGGSIPREIRFVFKKT